MIKLLTILIFTAGNALGQDYVQYFVTVPKEPGVINYQIQRSTNGSTSWTTLPNGTFTPKRSKDSNKYQYTLTPGNYYIRLKALFSNTIIYTAPQKITNINVSITNAKYRNNSSADNISFTAENEGAIDYYSIERSNNGTTWIVAGKLKQINKRNYTVNISKVGSNRRYKMRSVYKNGIVSPYINFQ